ncbi:hypothetical protein F4780DRAFT_785950 [Xylariomycetidae sp. FL0641]|nr:hypothetical protein F4780DRAFT_785950 [Xylariomycetidae sp. FL0641]
MAEALLAVASTAATFIQLVDFGSKVLRHRDSMRDIAGNLPADLTSLQSEVSGLLDASKQINDAIDRGNASDGIKSAVSGIFRNCRIQMQALDSILDKCATKNDSMTEKVSKAVGAARNDKRVSKIPSQLRSYMSDLVFYYTAAKAGENTQYDRDLRALHAWLKAPDTSPIYHAALEQRVEGTGFWLLSTPAYASWKLGKVSSLWTYGIPGSGKTIMSSTIVEDMQTHCQNDPGKSIAYYYFHFQEPGNHPPEQLLRSLLVQYAAQSPVIPSEVNNIRQNCERFGRSPSESELSSALQALLRNIPSSFLVIDALDECAGRPKVLKILGKLVEGMPNLHIVIASRPERDIETELARLPDG